MGATPRCPTAPAGTTCARTARSSTSREITSQSCDRCSTVQCHVQYRVQYSAVQCGGMHGALQVCVRMHRHCAHCVACCLPLLPSLPLFLPAGPWRHEPDRHSTEAEAGALWLDRGGAARPEGVRSVGGTCGTLPCCLLRVDTPHPLLRCRDLDSEPHLLGLAAPLLFLTAGRAAGH